MYRKYFCAEVVIFLLLSHVGWNGPSTTLISCSYEDSQIVQLLIEKKVLPILNRYRATLPLDCPFHSKRDVFGWPKQTLFAVSPEPFDSADLDNNGNWLCPMCGQKLNCEENSVIKSMEHIYISSNGDEDAVCLASYCDIMRCEVMSKKLKQEKLKSNDISLRTKKQQKKEIEYMENSQFAGQAKKKFANRGPCDPRKMEYLMERCRAVIRQCTVGLLINLSVKDFEDIEDEMNKAICSYLTCEKFWDDNITEVRHVAVYLCLILGVVIVGGFCLCYYIVWILFGALPHEEQQYMQNKPERRADVWCNDIYPNKNSGTSYLANGGPHVYQWAPMRTECVNQDQLIFRR